MIATTIQEKRQVPRVYSTHYLRVYHRITEQLLGRIASLSSTGFMLISDLPILVGQSFELTLVPPETLEHTTCLHFRAHSLWCKKDANPNYYCCGFKLVKVPDAFFEQVSRITQQPKTPAVALVED